MPEDGGEVEERVQRILTLLVDEEGPAVGQVGVIPSDALAHWQRRVTDDVVITRRQRMHYLEQHPEMIAYERALLLTLIAPYEVHSAAPGGTTAILYGKEDASHAIVAIVSISETLALKNSVITARRQRDSRKRSRSQVGRKVWGT